MISEAKKFFVDEQNNFFLAAWFPFTPRIFLFQHEKKSCAKKKNSCGQDKLIGHWRKHFLGERKHFCEGKNAGAGQESDRETCRIKVRKRGANMS